MVQETQEPGPTQSTEEVQRGQVHTHTHTHTCTNTHMHTHSHTHAWTQAQNKITTQLLHKKLLNENLSPTHPHAQTHTRAVSTCLSVKAWVYLQYIWHSLYCQPGFIKAPPTPQATHTYAARPSHPSPVPGDSLALSAESIYIPTVCVIVIGLRQWLCYTNTDINITITSVDNNL